MRRLDNWPDQLEDGESIEAYILKGLRKLDVEVAKMVADSAMNDREPEQVGSLLGAVVALLKEMMAVEVDIRPSYAAAATRLESIWERLWPIATDGVGRGPRVPEVPSFVRTPRR